MTITKHRRTENEAFNEQKVTFNKLTRAEHYMIVEALMTERSKYTKDHSEEANKKWSELSRLISVTLEAL